MHWTYLCLVVKAAQGTRSVEGYRVPSGKWRRFGSWGVFFKDVWAKTAFLGLGLQDRLGLQAQVASSTMMPLS